MTSLPVNARMAALLLFLPAIAAAPQQTLTYETFEAPGYDVPVCGVRYPAGEVRQGLPLGALGTGFTELNADGSFGPATIQNNMRPAGEYPRTFFAVSAATGATRDAALLRVAPELPLPGVRNARLFGHWPIADLEFDAPQLPVTARLRALCPFIPGDSESSALPLVLFRVSLKNPTDRQAGATVALSVDNDVPSPLTDSGNASVFMTKSVGPVAPHAQASATFLCTVAASEPDAAQNLARARAMQTRMPPLTDFSGAQAVLEGKGLKTVAIDRAAGFNWEANQNHGMVWRGTSNLGQTAWMIEYGSEPERAMSQFTPDHTRPEGVELQHFTTATDAARHVFVTTDDSLQITVTTRLIGEAVLKRTYTVRNLTDQTIDHVAVAHYMNFDPGGKAPAEQSRGRFDRETETAFITSPTGDFVCAMQCAGPPDRVKIGQWHETLNAMYAGGGLNIADLPPQPSLAYRTSPDSLHLGTSSGESGYALLAFADDDRIEILPNWQKVDQWWPKFAQDGAIASTGADADGTTAPSASGSAGEPAAGIIAMRTTIPAGATRSLDFALLWYFPDLRDSDGKRVGHHYAVRHDTIDALVQYIKRPGVRSRLWTRSLRWQERIYATDLPDWLKDNLINSLYSLAKNTWWIADGRFAHSESFTGCPIMETIVCRFAGSFPLLVMFPDLERNVLQQFADYQRDDGAIPFAFGGGNRMDAPYYETQKSLDTSEFILMLARYWRHHKQTYPQGHPARRRAADFLHQMMSVLDNAVAYGCSLDTDGDGLINEVSMQYYDVWRFHGTSCYVAGIWLSALHAAESLARQFDRPQLADKCTEWFDRGRRSYIDKLWNGRYHRLYNEPETGKVSEVCLGNQLAGQWYAYLLGHGEILPRDHITAALDRVLQLNGEATAFGIANGVRPDGTIEPGPHSDCISVGENFAILSTALSADYREDDFMEQVREACENIALIQRTPWNVYFNMSAQDGHMIWGQNYYSNMSVWSALLAEYRAGLTSDGLQVRPR